MVTNSRNKAKLLKSASFCRNINSKQRWWNTFNTILNKGSQANDETYKKTHFVWPSWKLPRSHVTQNGFVITSINKSIIFAVNCHTKLLYGLNVETCILLYISNSMLLVAVCLNLIVYLPICETLTPKKAHTKVQCYQLHIK